MSPVTSRRECTIRDSPLPIHGSEILESGSRSLASCSDSSSRSANLLTSPSRIVTHDLLVSIIPPSQGMAYHPSRGLKEPSSDSPSRAARVLSHFDCCQVACASRASFWSVKIAFRHVARLAFLISRIQGLHADSRDMPILPTGLSTT